MCYVPFRALLERDRYVRAVRAPISGGMVPVTENEVESDTPSRTLVSDYLAFLFVDNFEKNAAEAKYWPSSWLLPRLR